MANDRSLDILADLHMEIDSGSGFTHAHLNGGPGELVLDVDDPVQALRAGIGSGQLRTIQKFLPKGAFDGISVTVRSDGRALGQARFTGSGRLRVRPTPAGVRVIGSAGAGSTPVRLAVGAALLAAVAAVVGALRRRG